MNSWTPSETDNWLEIADGRQPSDACAGSSPEHQYHRYERALKTTLARLSPASAGIAVAKQCLRELERAMSELGPLWRVKPFGGAANGFAMPSSDLDVTCYLEGTEACYTPLATEELRTRLLPFLQKHPRFSVVDEIWTARVPILKLRFDHQLDVDLSCHNTEALHNTLLLRSYAELSPQVRELGLLVKLWAKGEGVCGAPQGYLSSYALTLMALYFLQVDPEVRMPCLPAVRHNNGASKRRRAEWSCPWPAQVLLARFFRFYAAEFQWGAEVVSVRLGRRSGSADPAYEQLRVSSSPRLHIEDPFLTGRNLHCVLGVQQECIFYMKLCLAEQAIQGGSLPVGLRRNARSAHSLRMTSWSAGAALSAAAPDAPEADVANGTLPVAASEDSAVVAHSADADDNTGEVQSTSTRATESGDVGGSKEGFEVAFKSSPNGQSTLPPSFDSGCDRLEGGQRREAETDSSAETCEEQGLAELPSESLGPALGEIPTTLFLPKTRGLQE